MLKHRMLVTAVAASLVLAGCGGGGSSSAVVAGPHLAGDIAVPGFTGAAGGASFDLGMTTNNSPGRYYFTDRNNAAVDVFEISGGTAVLLGSVKGTGANAFTGCFPSPDCVGTNNGKSGPDGIDQISATKIYVGDVDSVKVLVPQTLAPGGAITKKIPLSNGAGETGFRADEGCFDKDHNVYMISIPDTVLPAAVFINTITDTVIATVQWTGGAFVGASGNEACFYDTATQSFYVANDGTTANPRGEVDVIPTASITGLPGLGPTLVTNMGALAGVRRIPTPLCDPTGIVKGPEPELMVVCRPGNAGEALVALIFNKITGTLVASVPAGGADQIWYDPTSNRYALATNRWHNSGVNDKGGGCSATNLCNPKVTIVDAASKAVIARLDAGNNSHSVAVDPVTGEIFSPYSSATKPGGAVIAPGFGGTPDGGVLVFTIK